MYIRLRVIDIELRKEGGTANLKPPAYCDIKRISIFDITTLVLKNIFLLFANHNNIHIYPVGLFAMAKVVDFLVKSCPQMILAISY